MKHFRWAERARIEPVLLYRFIESGELAEELNLPATWTKHGDFRRLQSFAGRHILKVALRCWSFDR